jgi:hypothetical protein
MDSTLSESKRTAITSSYSKFSVYWASYLPFAVELLNNFLSDMKSIVTELNNTQYRDTDGYKGRWATCTNLFG